MFHNPHEAVIITDLADGSYELLSSVPSETASGWDSLTQTYLVRDSSAGLDPVASISSILLRGSQLAGLNMWIVSRAPRTRARGLFEVEITALGLLSPRGYKVNYDSSAASQTAANVLTPDGLYANVQTNEASPTCDLEYILIGVTAASTSFPTAKTGRPHNPPAPWRPAVPDTVWSALSEYTYNYPNGWVFDGVRAENLPGVTTIHLIRERYRYQYAQTP